MVQDKAPKFIKIGEFERRAKLAQQETAVQQAGRLAEQLFNEAKQRAKDEAERKAKSFANMREATAAAIIKKNMLIESVCTLRGGWAARAEEQLLQCDGVLEAVLKLQRALRRQASSVSG